MVIIDALSKVTIINGTSTEQNIKAFTDVFTRHGVPEVIRSNNGPPFNGNDSHLLTM